MSEEINFDNLLVSVVIPAFNEENNIINCIKSIKNQSYTGKVEIILADNGSTDKTRELAINEGIKIIREDRPGVCYARQAGTEIALGEIIISTDADTTHNKNWIKNIVEKFKEDDEIVAVGGHFIIIDGPKWKNIVNVFFKYSVRIFQISFNKVTLYGSNTAFKKSKWEGYDVKMNAGGDEIALARQLGKRGKIVFLFDNEVYTSGRRMNKGFLHFVIFYLFDYVYCLFTKKTIIPPRAIRLKDKNNKYDY
ncbi:MAG: glycosyltransferase family 2 protein [Candidatus Nomurabacteria bacterium]